MRNFKSLFFEILILTMAVCSGLLGSFLYSIYKQEQIFAVPQQEQANGIQYEPSNTFLPQEQANGIQLEPTHTVLKQEQANGIQLEPTHTVLKQEQINAIQQELANEVIRFHVLANSNSDIDQELKLLVKTTVLEYMSEPLNRSETAEEAIALLEKHTDDIIRTAQRVLAENGCYENVTAGIEDVYFPVKTYGDVTFPAGIYTAYRIIIGEGEGNNWWCVLYPPLCFVDITHGILPDESKETLKSVLTEEEYLTITDGTLNTDQIRFEFRLLPFLNQNPSDTADIENESP